MFYSESHMDLYCGKKALLRIIRNFIYLDFLNIWYFSFDRFPVGHNSPPLFSSIKENDGPKMVVNQQKSRILMRLCSWRRNMEIESCRMVMRL